MEREIFNESIDPHPWKEVVSGVGVSKMGIPLPFSVPTGNVLSVAT